MHASRGGCTLVNFFWAFKTKCCPGSQWPFALFLLAITTSAQNFAPISDRVATWWIQPLLFSWRGMVCSGWFRDSLNFAISVSEVYCDSWCKSWTTIRLSTSISGASASRVYRQYSIIMLTNNVSWILEMMVCKFWTHQNLPPGLPVLLPCCFDPESCCASWPNPGRYRSSGTYG